MNRRIEFQLVDTAKAVRIDATPDSPPPRDCGADWILTRPGVLSVEDAQTATWAPFPCETQDNGPEPDGTPSPTPRMDSYATTRPNRSGRACRTSWRSEWPTGTAGVASWSAQPSMNAGGSGYDTSVFAGVARAHSQLELMQDAMHVYRLPRPPAGEDGLPAAAPSHEHPADSAGPDDAGPGNAKPGPYVAGYDAVCQPDQNGNLYAFEQGGVKVEPLPGAEDLGLVDDMAYFRNNLFEALCFPKEALERN